MAMDLLLITYLIATVLTSSPTPGKRSVSFIANFNVMTNSAKVRLILHNPARRSIKIQLEKSDHTVIYEEQITRKTLQFYTVYNVDDLEIGKYCFVVSSASQTISYVFYVDPPFVKPYEPTKVISLESQQVNQ